MISAKNICFFNTTPFWGGGEKWHYESAKMMTITPNKTFFVLDGNGELANKLADTSVEPFHMKANNFSFLNPFKLKQLTKFYQNNKIDVVIFNSPKDLKLGGLAAKRAKVSTVVYRRGIAVEVKKNWLNYYLFDKVVTHFLFNSKATKALLAKNFKAILAHKKITVIYNAIDFDASPIQTTQLNNPLIIGNAGRLVEQKGQKHLISIAQQLKEKGLAFKMLIAGEGPLYKELEEEINKNNLSQQIELLGFVKDMPSFMQSIDIFVSTALWEGFGFVLAEAMAYKKPIIAFDLSSNPELIKEAENGFLIPPDNIDLFVEKLTLLLNNNEQRLQMGNEAYNFSKTNFDKEQQFRKLLDFLIID